MSVRDELEAAIRGGQTARQIAQRAGLSETALSLYRNRKYPAGVTRLEARIAEALRAVECPFLGRAITQAACRGFACRDVPTENPLALRHWHACQSCPHRPGPLPAAAPRGAGGPAAGGVARLLPSKESAHAL